MGSLLLFALLAALVAPSSDADAPAATDVLLIFDTTGSMTSALVAAKAEIESSIEQIDADLPNVRYGVAQVRDYGALYGNPDDAPWRLDQPITDDRTSVISAVEALHAAGGGSAPESYARALLEARGSSVGWRADARRIVVLIGDSYPHDDDLDEGIPSSEWVVGAPWDTGADPGPDEVVGTDDDLDWQSQLTQLAADNMPLMFLFYKGTDALAPYWQSWAAATGGLMESAGSGQLPGDLVYLVERGAGLPPCLDPTDTPPCAQVPADETTKWKGKRSDLPLDRAAGDRVPFQLRVTGSLTADGDLLKPATAQFSSIPDRTLVISSPGAPTATYQLSTGHFDQTEGVISSPPSLALSLDWPASPVDRGASLPLFSLSSHIEYQRTFAHANIDSSIQGSLTTSVSAIVAWADAHRWLGRAGRAAALASWLTQHGNRVPAAYGAPLQVEALTPLLRAFVSRAGQLADGATLERHTARTVGLKAAALSSGRGLRRTMPRWKAQVPAQQAPPGVDPAGLRQEFSVGPAGRRALKRGSWRRPVSLASRASAALLGMPVASQEQPLWTSARRVKAGGAITVLASGLRGARLLGVAIVGPGYSGEARLRARAGTAAAKLVLPATLARGTYWLGVLDFSRLDRPNGRVRVASARIAVTH